MWICIRSHEFDSRKQSAVNGEISVLRTSALHQRLLFRREAWTGSEEEHQGGSDRRAHGLSSKTEIEDLGPFLHNVNWTHRWDASAENSSQTQQNDSIVGAILPRIRTRRSKLKSVDLNSVAWSRMMGASHLCVDDGGSDGRSCKFYTQPDLETLGHYHEVLHERIAWNFRLVCR